MRTSYVDNEGQLKMVLDFCYDILGQRYREMDNYRYDDWQKRIEKYSRILIFAHEDDKIVAAVLGRPENKDSLVMGFVACDKNYRMRGITKMLVKQFEVNARSLGFKYITLGANKKAAKFYEKCGYKLISDVPEQSIFQKFL